MAIQIMTHLCARVSILVRLALKGHGAGLLLIKHVIETVAYQVIADLVFAINLSAARRADRYKSIDDTIVQ
jgi:hypothetical protein